MNYINEIFKFVGQAALITAIVTFLFRTYFKNLISQFFKKELEGYKHELNLITEEQKFDYQRKLHDFNLYRTNRHESYKILYQLALSVVNNIKNARKIRIWTDFENFTFDDVKAFLTYHIKDEFEVNNVYRRFEKQRDFSIIKSAIVSEDLKKLTGSISDLESYFYANELYYSNAVISAVKPLLPTIDDVGKVIVFQVYTEQTISFINEVESSFMGSKIKHLDNDIRTIEESVSKIKLEIVNELSIGEYQLEKDRVGET